MAVETRCKERREIQFENGFTGETFSLWPPACFVLRIGKKGMHATQALLLGSNSVRLLRSLSAWSYELERLSLIDSCTRDVAVVIQAGSYGGSDCPWSYSIHPECLSRLLQG